MYQSTTAYTPVTSFTRRIVPAQFVAYLIFFLELITFFSCMYINYSDKLSQIIILIVYIVSCLLQVYITVKCSYIDPSDDVMIEYRNNIQKRKGMDVSPYLYCDHCNSYVQESSRHCKVCKRCVSNFDHHCMWINNCIGDKNYVEFIFMIIATFINLLVYIIGMVILTIQSQWSIYLPQMLTIWVVSFIVAVFFILLANLIILHFYLILKGLTTYQFIMLQRQQKCKKKKIQFQPQFNSRNSLNNNPNNKNNTNSKLTKQNLIMTPIIQQINTKFATNDNINNNYNNLSTNQGSNNFILQSHNKKQNRINKNNKNQNNDDQQQQYSNVIFNQNIYQSKQIQDNIKNIDQEDNDQNTQKSEYSNNKNINNKNIRQDQNVFKNINIKIHPQTLIQNKSNTINNSNNNNNINNNSNNNSNNNNINNSVLKQSLQNNPNPSTSQPSIFSEQKRSSHQQSQQQKDQIFDNNNKNNNFQISSFFTKNKSLKFFIGDQIGRRPKSSHRRIQSHYYHKKKNQEFFNNNSVDVNQNNLINRPYETQRNTISKGKIIRQEQNYNNNNTKNIDNKNSNQNTNNIIKQNNNTIKHQSNKNFLH